MYFDNACMSLKPNSVVSAMDEYYFKYPTQTGVYTKMEIGSQKKVKDSREAVAKFITKEKMRLFLPEIIQRE